MQAMVPILLFGFRERAMVNAPSFERLLIPQKVG